MTITDPYIATGFGADGRAGVYLKSNAVGGGGNLYDYGIGPEPAMGNVPDWSAGWVEIKLEVDVDASVAATEIRAYQRPATSGAWTQMGTHSCTGWTPTHIGLIPSVNATLDDLEIDIVPEPATMIMLALGGGLALRRRR